MIRKLALTVTFTLLSAFATHAAEDPGDTAQEVIAGHITLPANDRGDVIVKVCSSCKEHVFATTPSTTYEIGEEHVRLDVMRRELARRSRELLLLQLTEDRRHVARIYIGPAGK
jgi:hypothetical protein